MATVDFPSSAGHFLLDEFYAIKGAISSVIFNDISLMRVWPYTIMPLSHHFEINYNPSPLRRWNGNSDQKCQRPSIW
jgi:hypothetical protein